MTDSGVAENRGSNVGDGLSGIAEERAALAFERLSIEMLRGIARGGESSHAVGSALRELYASLTTDEVRLFRVMHLGLQAVNDRLIPDDAPYDEDLRWLLRAAIRLAAEKLATDGFAKGRASQRERDLRGDIERYILNVEKEARKFGGSYLGGLLRKLPPLPPPAKPKVERKGRTKKPVKPFKL